MQISDCFLWIVSENGISAAPMTTGGSAAAAGNPLGQDEVCVNRCVGDLLFILRHTFIPYRVFKQKHTSYDFVTGIF